MKLILMPGMDGTGELFAPLIGALGSSIESIVVRYPTDQPLTYSELFPQVRAALPRSGPFVLLGESFSGPLALMLAAEAPVAPAWGDPVRVICDQSNPLVSQVGTLARATDPVSRHAPIRASQGAARSLRNTRTPGLADEGEFHCEPGSHGRARTCDSGSRYNRRIQSLPRTRALFTRGARSSRPEACRQVTAASEARDAGCETAGAAPRSPSGRGAGCEGDSRIRGQRRRFRGTQSLTTLVRELSTSVMWLGQVPGLWARSENRTLPVLSPARQANRCPRCGRRESWIWGIHWRASDLAGTLRRP